MDTYEAFKKAWTKAREDFEWFCKHFVKIKDKRGRVVPFELNPAQQKIWREIKRQIDAEQPVRVVVLKARQQGVSTLSAALCAWTVFLREGQGWLTVGHRLEPAKQLFAKLEFTYDKYPEEFRPEKAPGTRTGSLLQLKDVDSLAFLETAENVDLGRSGTFQHAHLTELPWWRDTKKSMDGLLQSIPELDGTTIIVESTAEGIGDYFHGLWVDALKGKNGFTAVFCAWFETPEYSRPRRPDDAPLSTEEKRIKKKYKLTDSQLLWRRDKIAQMGLEKFNQEYPAEWREAFLVGGTKYFGTSELRYVHSTIRKPLREGDFEVGSDGRTRFKDWDYGPWRIWVPPNKDHEYALGIDPSSGTAQDYGVIQVVDVHEMEQVARFRGHIDPDLLAVESIRAGRLYNNALAVPDRVGEGRATVLKLRELGYERIFIHSDADSLKGKHGPVWGWATSNKTRPVMLTELQQALRQQELTVYDEDTYNEMLSFVRVPGSRIADHAQGAHDDTVMALAMANSSEVRASALATGGFVEAEPFTYF